jgi:hypothetical protein
MQPLQPAKSLQSTNFHEEKMRQDVIYVDTHCEHCFSSGPPKSRSPTFQLNIRSRRLAVYRANPAYARNTKAMAQRLVWRMDKILSQSGAVIPIAFQ